MNSDEQAIFDYLKTQPKEFVTVREIWRRAGNFRKAERDPASIKPILVRMVKKDLLEANVYGQFRIKPEPEKAARKQIPLAPHIRKILEQSGKIFILDEDIDTSPPKDSKPDNLDKEGDKG